MNIEHRWLATSLWISAIVAFEFVFWSIPAVSRVILAASCIMAYLGYRIAKVGECCVCRNRRRTR